MRGLLFELHQVAVERNQSRLLSVPALRIPVGEDTCIFGPNGSGKSTLLKLWMRFFYPSVVHDDVGEVRILGRTDWNVWELRSQLGFVSSEIDHHFTSGRSGRLRPFEATLTGFESSELALDPEQITSNMNDAAKEWLDFFEVDSASTKQVSWLSTGERRRVMLARAMVRGPQAMLLDEPTAGLDLVAREKLLVKLQTMSERGVQLILVTHHLEEVLPSMKRCLLLHRGQIFHDGSPCSAFTPEMLSAIFERAVHVEKDSIGYRAWLCNNAPPTSTVS